MPHDGRGRVVLGVDGSLAGLAAVRFAVAHARATGMPVRALRAWVAPQWRDQTALRWRLEVAAEAVEAMHAAFDAAMGGPPADVPMERLIVEGFAGELLVGCADREGDLLVIGGRRQAPPHARTTGPVTRHCLRHARCPVVVVPAPPLTGGVHLRRLVRQIAQDLRRLS